MIATAKSIILSQESHNSPDSSENRCNSAKMMGVVCCVCYFKMSKGWSLFINNEEGEKLTKF